MDLASTAPLEDSPGSGAEHRLLVVRCDGVATFTLPASGSVSIGRAAGCDLRIDDPTVSRYHARLVIGDVLTIEDLGSANGTQVALRAVMLGAPTPVQAGEAIRIGAVLAMVQRRRRTAARPSPGDAMASLRARVALVAQSDVNVLIQGETGVGKEVLASELHRASLRGHAPITRINCAALSDALVESELFGHERGAFTGAAAAKPGLLELSSGGTILLDEVGEAPLAMQAKLLRVVEQREVTRVGGLQPRPLNARFVAATNRELDSAILRGEFRSDLYYRLAGVVLRIPPLRERKLEIAALAAGFLAEFCVRHRRPAPVMTDAARAALMAHDWPGNIRELRNVIEGALVLTAGDTLDVDQLPLALPATAGTGVRAELRATERRRMIDALSACGGNQSAAATLLGIPRRTFLKRLDEYAIARPRKPLA